MAHVDTVFPYNKCIWKCLVTFILFHSFNILFISVWTHVYLPWVIIQYCYYFVVQIVSDFGSWEHFQVGSYVPLLGLPSFYFFENFLTFCYFKIFLSCIFFTPILEFNHFSKMPVLFYFTSKMVYLLIRWDEKGTSLLWSSFKNPQLQSNYEKNPKTSKYRTLNKIPD